MDKILRPEERIVYALRALYAGHGCRPYRMNKFEEYDLYANNRSFLPAGGVLTFTDTNGRLMALKPDVTLSIVKNLSPEPGERLRVYYDESVYRAPDRQLGFQEITQAGLEYLGAIDAGAEAEVLMLAAKSLELIEPGYALELSHMGFVTALIDEMGCGDAAKPELLRAVGSRSVPGIRAAAARCGVAGESVERLCAAVSLYGGVRETLRELEGFSVNAAAAKALEELRELCAALEGLCDMDRLNLDLSMASDTEYYNGLVFKGFVPGAPAAVLSGGRYDGLLRRLGKTGGAVGFAVYLNLLDRVCDNAGGERG